MNVNNTVGNLIECTYNGLSYLKRMIVDAVVIVITSALGPFSSLPVSVHLVHLHLHFAGKSSCQVSGHSGGWRRLLQT